jgi:hypothetical protein
VGKERTAYRHLFLCLVQYGTRGKYPSLSCNGFFLAVLKWRLMLISMSILNSTLDSVPSSTQHLTAFHIRAITCDRPGNAGTWLMISQKMLGLMSAELGRSSLSSVATRRNLTGLDVMELILEMGYHQKMKTFLLRVTFALTVTRDTTDTNFTQWTDNTNCQPTVPIVHKFTRGASELRL